MPLTASTHTLMYVLLMRSPYKVSTINIFDVSAGTSKISVFDAQNQRIDEDIFVSEFIIWNSGNTNMPKDKIRVPLAFALSGKGRIIDYAIADEAPKGVAGFSLDALPEKGPVKSLKLSWQYFDPDYGAKVRVIYSGTEKVKIKFVGSLSGIRGGFRNMTNVKAGDFFGFGLIAAWIILIFVGPVTWVADYLAQKFTHEENKFSEFINSVTAKRIVIGLISIAIIIGVVLVIVNWPPTPPL